MAIKTAFGAPQRGVKSQVGNASATRMLVDRQYRNGITSAYRDAHARQRLQNQRSWADCCVLIIV